MKTIVFGVAGGTGSGKTTVAHRILDRVGAGHFAYLPHDAYYKDLSHMRRDARGAVNFDHPDSLDTALLIEHVEALRDGRAIAMPDYDFTRHVRRSTPLRVEPGPIVLVEGILIFAEPLLRALMDIRVYVDTAADERVLRRIKRDMEERGRTLDMTIRQYLDTVRPMHDQFVEPSKRYADIIIPQGGHNDVAIAMVSAELQRRLDQLPLPSD